MAVKKNKRSVTLSQSKGGSSTTKAKVSKGSNGSAGSKKRVSLSLSKTTRTKGNVDLVEKSKSTLRQAQGDRVKILKTYKIFIGGKFPRTESGRYYQPLSSQSPDLLRGRLKQNDLGEFPLGNICLGSRKDIRNAVVAARKAQRGWASRTAYNRSQILYRIGEMLEGRSAQFVDELMLMGANRKQAEAQVNESIDRCIYYAGWCDKYQQIFSSVNPVASAHFNFSVQEPTGVVGLVAPSESPLLGFVSALLPIIAGGNTAVVIAPENKPLCAVSFAEVLATSDLPGGVVNIITGKTEEMLKPMVQHMDVNAIVVYDSDDEERTFLQKEATCNLKRVIFPELASPEPAEGTNWFEEDARSPYLILQTQETKTTWHPIEVIGTGGSGY